MGMPIGMRILRDSNPIKYKEACRRGGLAAAAKKARQREAVDVTTSVAAYRAAQEEAALRESTNEHLLSTDGDIME